MIGRIISGLSTGINAVIVPLYIKEMSPHAQIHETEVNNIMPLYTKEKSMKEISGRTGTYN